MLKVPQRKPNKVMSPEELLMKLNSQKLSELADKAEREVAQSKQLHEAHVNRIVNK
jgi:hypothetical protein